MQNLPIFTAQPVTPTQTQTSTPSDNNASQATEPFGNVLARQRANADSPQQGSKQSDVKQQGPSAANDATATPTAAANAAITPASIPDVPSTQPKDKLAALLLTTPATSTTASKDKAKDKINPQAVVPDGGSSLPSGILVTLLPAAPATNSTASKDTTSRETVSKDKISKDKVDPQAPAPAGINTLPGDMLAMMSPGNAGTSTAIVKDKTNVPAPAPAALPGDMLAKLAPTNTTQGKGLQESLSNGSKKAGETPITTAALGASLQAAENKAISATPLAGVGTSKENTFAVALGALGKDGVKTPQLDLSATKTHMQAVASTAMNSLMQNGMTPVVASQSGPTHVLQAVINTPVTDQAWGNDFNQKITWMATQKEQTAELHLNPPNLGPLDVVLKVSGDQATALFTSPHAAVREAVEQALPQLRNMMADNGITLGNAMVSDQSPKDQQAWQASQQRKGNGDATGTIDVTAAGGITSSSTAALGRRHEGMVDTFA